MNPELSFRTARKADGSAVRTLVFEVLTEYGLHGDPTTTDADLDDLPAYYLDPGGMFELLETANGELVGTVGLVPLDHHRAELRKMYLHPNWRGRGLGKRLLERALQRARDLGLQQVELETASALKEAIALYERYGFKRKPAPQHLSPQCNLAFVLDLTP